MKKTEVSIIIPAYNEEEGIDGVVEEIRETLDNEKLRGEIVIVDDGSTDNTYSKALSFSEKYPGIKVLKHDENKGKVVAIRTGIKNATGDTIVLTDADFTYPAEYIPQMINKIVSGADLVLGSRFVGKAKNMPLLNKTGNRLFSFLISYFGGREIRDGQTGYRAFRRDEFEKLDVDARGLEFETKMTIKAAKLGYKIVEIPILYRTRIGKSKLNPIRDGYMMLKAIADIAVSETSTLGKVMIFPSVFLFLAGLGFGAISIKERITQGILTHAYFPLISTLFILLAIQLFSLGIILDNLTKHLERIEERL